jgi:hypothetical protein
MLIFQSDDRNEYPGSAPAIAISADAWNDYGLNTTFNVTLWLSDDERVDLRSVKIMQLGMKSGTPQLPTMMPDGLPEDCASLGADFDYYELILALDAELGDDIFSSLRDLAVDREIHDLFSKDDAFHTSLIRLAPAKDALSRLSKLEGALAPEDSTRVRMAELTAVLRNASADRRQADGADPESAPTRAQDSLRLRFTPRARPDRELNPPSLLLDFDRLARLPSNVIALSARTELAKPRCCPSSRWCFFQRLSRGAWPWSSRY